MLRSARAVHPCERLVQHVTREILQQLLQNDLKAALHPHTSYRIRNLLRILHFIAGPRYIGLV